LKGLANRRAAEAGLWAKGEFVASRHVKPRPVDDNPLQSSLKQLPLLWTHCLALAVCFPVKVLFNMRWPL